MIDTPIDSKLISLPSLERELAERLVQLATFLGETLGTEMDLPLIKSREPVDKPIWAKPEDIDLSQYRIGRDLPYFFNYAFNARCIEGRGNFEDWGTDYDSRQLFEEFLELTDTEGVKTSAALDVYWGLSRTMEATGKKLKKIESGLWGMLKLCDARYRLDFLKNVTIADIALLANMNERSVMNALRLEGENRLHSVDGEAVKSEEALRWLRGRKSGFRETTFISFKDETVPPNLSFIELAPFIRNRLEKHYGDQYWAHADELGYTPEQLNGILENIEALPLKDTQRIARMLKVDPVWFTEQVFTALFPEQMELIMHKSSIEYEDINIDLEDKPFIEITLSEKGIKNGYIDIPKKYASFFPKDCFGDRAKDRQGKPIEIRFGSEVRNTDIRVKSSITISPRARFGGYFNNILHAKAGDTLKIYKEEEERVFEIKYFPNP